ncbi:MAG: carboxypeptidase-like regulatory domain-containing protein [Saprospiraceae bacterium]
MEIPAPRFKGFAIELPLFKYSVNIQDGNKQPVQNASVKVTGIRFLETGATDGNGCYFGSGELYQTYSMLVQKTGFLDWTHQFVLLMRKDLPKAATKNFPVIIRNPAGSPIAGAAVNISSNLPHTDAGASDAQGLFEGLVQNNHTNTITIQASGYQPYTSQFTAYASIWCFEKAIIAVPVITLHV